MPIPTISPPDIAVVIARSTAPDTLRLIGVACVRHGINKVLVVCPSGADAVGLHQRSLDVEIVTAEGHCLAACLVDLVSKLPDTFFLFDAEYWLDINLLDLALLHSAAEGRWLTFARGRGEAAPADATRLGVSVVDRHLVATLNPDVSFEDAIASQELAGRVGFVSCRSDDGAKSRGALFLDRDGVVNEDVGFVADVERFRWMRGVPEAIKWANDSGFLVFVVTNQSGVARGFFDESDVHLVHRHIQAELRVVGAHIDDFRYCPYYPDGIVPRYKRDSSWRKPNPGMLIDLMSHWDVDASRSLMVGDRDSDVAAGRAAGVEGYKIRADETLSDVLDRFLASLGRA